MTVRQAIILAAGQGSRLLPLTLEKPKCLIEVGGRTILAHQIAALRHSGVERFTIVAGYRAEQIEAEAEALRGQGIEIEAMFNPFWAVASSIGSVWTARERLLQPFLLLNGDTIFDADLLAEALGRLGPGLNLLVERTIEPEEDDMRVVVSGDAVQKVGKGLSLDEAAHRSLGVIASCGPKGERYGRMLEQVLRSPDGADSFHHAIIDQAAREYGVRAVEIGAGFWQEIDRPEDIDRWNRLHFSGATALRSAAG
jgi:choline kinase